MSLQSYTRLELAGNQLESAIALFISGRDRFSVISLAGAADVILSRLVLNSGQENFTDVMLKYEQVQPGLPDQMRAAMGKSMNDTLFVNQLKHLDDGEDGFIELEPEDCALGAILKALANYASIEGHRKELVGAFKLWVKRNLDPKKYNVDCDPNWKGNDTQEA